MFMNSIVYVFNFLSSFINVTSTLVENIGKFLESLNGCSLIVERKNILIRVLCNVRCLASYFLRSNGLSRPIIFARIANCKL